MPTVVLNSQPYHIRGRIKRRSQEPFAQVFRTVGLQRREDIQTVTSFVFSPPIGGFGLNRMRDIADPLQAAKFWDSQVETRFGDRVSLAILDADSTEATGTEVIRASAAFGGRLWSLWEYLSAGNRQIASRRYTGGTTIWDGGGQFTPVNTTAKVGLDLLAHKARLIALFATSSGLRAVFSTDGITWTSPTTDIVINLSDAVTANENIDGGLLAQVGNQLIAVLWDEAGGTITFASSADAGTTWVDEAVDIPSGNGPQGVAIHQGIDGVTKLIVATREGLWEVDPAPATWTTEKILDLPPHNDNGRRMTVHQGKVWFGLGVDNNSPAPVYTMEVRGDLRVWDTALGLDQGDGVPSDLLGPIRWMKSAGAFLFASIGGGAASRNGRVICHNGIGWHHMFRDATANEQIQWIDVSADDDGTPRLHFAIRTSASASNTRFLAQPLVNSQSGVAITRQTSGLLDRPEFNGGMQRTPTNWLEVFLDGVDLSTTIAGEYIAIAYGLNGAARDTTSLGNILSGDLDLQFGTGGVGVSGRSIAIRETYNRDAAVNTDSPKSRGTELTYLKLPGRIEAWAFEVDLLETAKLTQQGSVEAVIANLRTAEANVPMVTFIYSKETSRNVHVEPLQYEEALGEEGEIVVPDREGFVTVVVRELLPA